MADINKVKKLREETGISVQECKKALEDTGGDLEKAKKELREKGQKMAKEKAKREADQGIVESYIHSNNKIGALIKLKCESGFVARSDEFKELAHELCMQIAAASPLFLKPEDIPEEVIDGEKKIYRKQVEGSGKSEEIVQKIIKGKLKKYKEKVSLLTQSWIKNEDKTVEDLLNEYIAKLGENIVIEEFERFEI